MEYRDTPWQDYETFKRLYITENQTQEDLAKVWNCSKPTIAVWARKHQLRKSSPGSPLRGSPSPTDEAIKMLTQWESLPDSLKPEARKLLHEMVDGL